MQSHYVIASWLANMAMNAAAAIGGNALFPRSVADVSDSHATPITPPHTTFMIWIVIYALWALMTFGRRRPSLANHMFGINALEIAWLLLFGALCLSFR